MSKNKAFQNIEDLRSYLVSRYNHIHSWRILQRTEFPGAKPGTLSRIANDVSYEPKHQEVREVLRISPSCTSCGAPIHKHPRKVRTPVKKTYYEKWWDGLKPEKRKKLKFIAYQNQ